MGSDPLRHGPAILERGRELVLGGKPVVHRDDDALGPGGEAARDHVLGIEIADDEAAAMEIGDHRKRPCPFRGIDTHRNFARRAR